VGHPSGIRILALLDELGPLGVTALADADRSSQPTVSGAVQQLVEEGWVA
jgi:DNA-binding MarR family transcriptional regulator